MVKKCVVKGGEKWVIGPPIQKHTHMLLNIRELKKLWIVI